MGRDYTAGNLLYRCYDFNSRARMGRDDMDSDIVNPDTQFQFTRPHGARQAKQVIAMLERRFQFTRPHGARRRRKK